MTIYHAESIGVVTRVDTASSGHEGMGWIMVETRQSHPDYVEFTTVVEGYTSNMLGVALGDRISITRKNDTEIILWGEDMHPLGTVYRYPREGE